MNRHYCLNAVVTIFLKKQMKNQTVNPNHQLVGGVSPNPSENALDSARKITNDKENHSRMKTEKVDKRYVIRLTKIVKPTVRICLFM